MSLTSSQTSKATTVNAATISAYAMTDAIGRVYEQAARLYARRHAASPRRQGNVWSRGP
jgi:hypothetical protein